MRKLPSMVDMARSPKEMAEGAVPQAPVYPYGLCLRLEKDQLEKLDVDYGDWAVGDNFHLFCLAKVTSIRKSETADGEDCSVEMQICEIAGEDEDDENLESEEESE